MAVGTATGPHVTPGLFTVSGDRIVCLAASSTLKVRRSRTERLVGLAASSSSGSLTAQAAISVIDPVDPRTFAAAPGAAATSPLAVARFVFDNAEELVGAAVDAFSGRLGMPPARRVVLVLSLLSGTCLDADGVVWSEGWAPGASAGVRLEKRTTDRPAPAVRPDGIPAALADLVREGPCVLGWTRRNGTSLALPAVWDGRSTAVVRRPFVDAVDAAPASPASVAFDGWTGLGPSGKQGVMLRGGGRLQAEDDTVRAEIDVARLVWWDGIKTGSRSLAS